MCFLDELFDLQERRAEVALGFRFVAFCYCFSVFLLERHLYCWPREAVRSEGPRQPQEASCLNTCACGSCPSGSSVSLHSELKTNKQTKNSANQVCRRLSLDNGKTGANWDGFDEKRQYGLTKNLLDDERRKPWKPLQILLAQLHFFFSGHRTQRNTSSVSGLELKYGWWSPLV